MHWEPLGGLWGAFGHPWGPFGLSWGPLRTPVVLVRIPFGIFGSSLAISLGPWRAHGHPQGTFSRFYLGFGFEGGCRNSLGRCFAFPISKGEGERD